MHQYRLMHTDFPVIYNSSWLYRYESASGRDAQLKLEEMRAFETLLRRHTELRIISSSFLDIGTCTGRYLRWAHQKEFEKIVGIDRSVDSILYCSKTLSFSPELHCLNVISEPEQRLLVLLGGQFDLITVMFGTINHFNSIEQLKVIQRMSRILKNDGLLIISSWIQDRCSFSLYEDLTSQALSIQQVSIDRMEYMAHLADLELTAWTETGSHRLFSIAHHQNSAVRDGN